MIDLSGEEHQEVVNTPMKKRLREPGYLQIIIIIEILKKKEKENDCYISGKKRKQQIILFRKYC